MLRIDCAGDAYDRELCTELIKTEFARKSEDCVSGNEMDFNMEDHGGRKESSQGNVENWNWELARLQRERVDCLQTLADVFDRAQRLDKPLEVSCVVHVVSLFSTSIYTRFGALHCISVDATATLLIYLAGSGLLVLPNHNGFISGPCGLSKRDNI